MTLQWEVWGGRFTRRPSDSGPYVLLRADLTRDGDTLSRLQITASPKGRNVHVFVDGVRYVPAGSDA